VNNLYSNNAEVNRAYEEYERQMNLRFLKVACYLVAVLMPMGTILDWLVYPDYFQFFFRLRLLCAGLAGVIWVLLHSKACQQFHRLLCLSIAWLPAFFICWMIYEKDGANSPYYAGLNLILLAIPLVVRWSVELSVVGTITVIGMYIAACLLHETQVSQQHNMIANNLYFIFLTGLIVIVSGGVHRSLRIREFSLSYELQKNKNELESTNTKLFEQNLALGKANREIKEAEAQLIQAEKMSSLGRFSAGLMHDIGNQLNYIVTNTFTLRKKTRQLPPELQSELGPIFSDIEDGLQRVDNIVSDLRTFSHPGEQPAEAIDLADIFKLSLRFVSGELKEKNIALDTNLFPGQKVWFNRNQFILVLVNLLENAIDALEEKKFADGIKPTITIASRLEGDRSLIFIRDNGPGIKPENQAKIFDPFFTTKDVGKGTGLGLSNCFGILRGYGSTIAVNSVPGEFCEFILDLPAHAAAKTKPENAERLQP